MMRYIQLISNPEINFINPNGLTVYENNPRHHSRKQIAQIADSIREFGFINPILVDENNMVLAGHGRLEAANMIGLSTVPIIQVGGLTEAQKRAYIIADNQLAANSSWNNYRLQNEFVDLMNNHSVELTSLGFEDKFIESFLGQDNFPTFNQESVELEELPQETNNRLRVIADCDSELQQEEIYHLLKDRGINCRMSK